MTDAYVIAVDGLAATRTLDSIPREIAIAAYRAINKTADRTRARSARAMREQVNFPARYLSGKDGRLAVSKKARADDLEAVVTGRHRPTSLARFSTSGTPGQQGVRVQVAPGFARFMRRAFLIRLRAGDADLDTRSNLGLAIRLRPGERPENKKKMVQMGNGLWILYGPAVSQVFRTVADDEAPGAAQYLEQEFSRLMELDL